MLNKLGIILCLAVFFSALSLAQDNPDGKMQQQTKTWNTIDPVDGSTVDADVSTVQYNDKIWGFSSEDNAAAFKEKPVMYAANLNEDGTKFIGKKDKQESDKY